MASTDQIRKEIVLRAARSRVWRALTDSSEFGSWFGMIFDGPFAAGKSIRGTLTPTTVDAEVAKSQSPYAGMKFEFVIDRVEPERFFSFQWHPFAVDPSVDYSKEPPTTVLFELAEAPGGTVLTVTESGFDRIPLERRAKAFAANEGGWAAQMRLIEKYVGKTG